MERKSNTIPVRVSALDREPRRTPRSELRKPQTSKARPSTSADTHIPKIRLRPSSTDRQSKASLIKPTQRSNCKTPLRLQTPQHVPTTPNTPRSNPLRVTITASGGNNRFHMGLPTGRRSLSADRISSIGGKGTRKDPRPLTDKLCQLDMLEKIDSYFHKQQCSSMLNNNGSLKPVTLKMFVEVSNHLMKTIGIKQCLTLTNYMEELPKIAKKLHYPSSIAKSWLKTANTMHSWPNVLGWISWLVDRAQMHSIAQDQYSYENLPFTGSETEAKSKKHMFYSMIDFYKAWNDELQEEEDALTKKYLEQVEEEEGVSNEKLDEAQVELQEYRHKKQVATDDCNKVENELEALKQQLIALQKEEAQQLLDIQMNEDYMKDAQSDIEKIEEESVDRCEMIASGKDKREELLLCIKEQPVSKDEMDNILKKQTEKENYIAQFEEHLQDIRNELYSLDMKLATISSNLNKYVLLYNKEIFMTLKSDIGVDLEELKFPETGILHPDIMKTLSEKTNLMCLVKDELEKQIAPGQLEIEADSKEMENLQMRIQTLQNESDDITNKMETMKRKISKIKSDAEKEGRKQRDQIETMEKEIQSIEESIPNLEEMISELEEVKEKLDAVQRRKEYLEESAKIFFNEFYKIQAEHRKELCAILKKR